MSYLSNNPFSRPTPNFSSNINTFNTYSGNDYVSMASKNYGSTGGYGSSYGYGTSPTYSSGAGYFGTTGKNQSAQYKYSRAVQSNPFSTGQNPFTTSTTGNSNPFAISNVSGFNDKPYLHEGNNEKYSRPSHSYGSSYQNNNNASTSITRKQFSYQHKLSTTSGFTDPYQESHFKNDKYSDKFRKSNFQADFQIQLGKSREMQIDQKYKVGTKQTEISNMLYNSPFHRASINSQTSKYAPQPIENPYTSSNKKYDQNNYKDPYLVTSNVKPIAEFASTNEYDQFATNAKDYLKNDPIYSNTKNYQYETFDFNNENNSQRDSRNTLINKFDDIPSSKAEYDEKNQRNSQNAKTQQKQLENPFIRNSNPFLNSDKLSVKSPNTKVQAIGKPIEQDFRISASSGSSSDISLGDFEDIQKKKISAESVQEKYDKYIFRRSSDGSKKSNYDQKVQDKFDLWQKQSRKSDQYYDVQNNEKDFQFNDFTKKSQKSLKYEKTINKAQDSFGQNKQSMKSLPMKQSLTQKTQIKQVNGNRNAFLFMKQSTQRQRSVKNEVEVIVQKNKKSLTEYDFNPSKNSKAFKFAGQNFEDEEDGLNDFESSFQRNRRQIEQGLKRISEVSLSQQRETQPNFSKKQSKASLTQNNTEQIIDEKLQKLRYNYDKKPIQQKQSPKINDFIDINLDDEGSNEGSFVQQSSFQQISPVQNQEQNLQNSRKRINLKEKMISSSKKLVFTSQEIQEDTKNPHQQNPLNIIHHRLEAKIQSLKKQTQIPLKQKQSPERYQFQALEQFEQKYQYNMKGSGFDFDDDSFEETERKLGIEDDYVKGSFDKVLPPEFGYNQKQKQNQFKKDTFQRDTFQRQQQHTVKPARGYISSASSNSQRPSNLNKEDENEDFLPTFNMKDSLNEKKYPESEIRKTSHRPLVSQNAKPIMSSIFQPQKKKEGTDKKVHRVKIYESEDELNRNSGQYEAYVFGNAHLNQSSKRQSVKLFENEDNEEEENSYKSPFEKKIHFNQPKRSSRISDYQHPKKEPTKTQANLYEYKSSRNPETKWGSQNILHKQQRAMEMGQQQNEEDSYMSIEDLRETKKHVSFGSRAQNYKEQPVRDSFESNGNEKQYQKMARKQVKLEDSLRRQGKRKFPQSLELKGNIYHMIQLVQN